MLSLHLGLSRRKVAPLIFSISTLFSTTNLYANTTVGVIEKPMSLNENSQALFRPIATFRDGKWDSAGRYDGTMTGKYAAPKPEESEAYWELLTSQPFHAVYDANIKLMGQETADIEGPNRERIRAIRGQIGGRLSQEYPIVLWNRESVTSTPERKTTTPLDQQVLQFCKTEIPKMEDQASSKPSGRGFDSELAQGFVVTQAISFPFAPGQTAYWITVVQEYSATDVNEKPHWSATCHVIASTVNQGSDSENLNILWSSCTLDNGYKNVGVFYKFIAALDVTGDGVMEVIMQERLFELSRYYMFEVKSGKYIVVAAGCERGI
ncbi:MAG: hypothetical protein SGI88_07575 [Candidatus Hydrogenedentes bacterium]|nr:hypothetical protein [Candidatus Hydrogenedentota bacterium]